MRPGKIIKNRSRLVFGQLYIYTTVYCVRVLSVWKQNPAREPRTTRVKLAAGPLAAAYVTGDEQGKGAPSHTRVLACCSTATGWGVLCFLGLRSYSLEAGVSVMLILGTRHWHSTQVAPAQPRCFVVTVHFILGHDPTMAVWANLRRLAMSTLVTGSSRSAVGDWVT